MLINLRNAMLGGTRKGEYVDHVYMDTNCGVNTGILPSGNFRWIINVKCVGSTSDSVFGTMGATDDNDFRIFWNTPIYFDVPRRRNQLSGWNLQDGLWHEYDVTPSSFKRDGVSKTIAVPSTISIPYPICINADTVATASQSNRMGGLIYLKDMTMYSDGVVVRQFRAYRDAAGNACLYDDVSQAPFYSVGSSPIVFDPE